MSLPKDFWEQLPRKTDEELCEILAHQDDYLPEALEAAKTELDKRKLSPERITQIEASAQSNKAAEEIKANERLSWLIRILIFLICSGLIGAILAVYYDSKGYNRKAKECWITMGISIVFSFVIGLLLYLIR